MTSLMSDAPKCWVIIPAAGSGSRMKCDTPKQYLMVMGKTIIEHTMGVFLNSSRTQSIMVCLPKSDQVFSTLGICGSPQVNVIAGGDSRAHSVLNGLRAVDADANDWVLVHDAARPCFNNDLLNRLINELVDDAVGGIMAVPAKDTLKLCDPENRVKSTIDRTTVWQAQTPQMFRYGLLKSSLSMALDNGIGITDEASAMEWAGYRPKLIEGDARNIKVTTPEDLTLVEFLLGREVGAIHN